MLLASAAFSRFWLRSIPNETNKKMISLLFKAHVFSLIMYFAFHLIIKMMPGISSLRHESFFYLPSSGISPCVRTGDVASGIHSAALLYKLTMCQLLIIYKYQQTLRILLTISGNSAIIYHPHITINTAYI